jgi:transcriptional regulator of arginine metabolism
VSFIPKSSSSGSSWLPSADSEDRSTDERRNLIQDLIRNHRVSTQDELRSLLKAKGFEVTQATLSRDLARLKARRVTLPEGGSVYELEDAPAPAEMTALRELDYLVVAIRESLALVVVQTRIGAASSVALEIDRARFPEVAGTLAGDDALFVAPVLGVPVKRLARVLAEALGFREEPMKKKGRTPKAGRLTEKGRKKG